MEPKSIITFQEFKDIPEKMHSSILPEIIPEIYTKEDRKFMRLMLERRMLERDTDMRLIHAHRNYQFPRTSDTTSVDRKFPVLSYILEDDETILRRLTNETDPDTRDYRDYFDRLVSLSKHGEKPSDTSISADSFFRKLNNTHTDFAIWKIENITLVPLPKEQFGTFHSDESYLICAISQMGSYVTQQAVSKEIKGKAEFHVHYWMGKKANVAKATAAAYKAVELDIFLGGRSTEHREIQGYETPRFKSYFPHGITVLNSTTKSMSKHDASLYKIKGSKAANITQMAEVSWKFLNSADVYVLLTRLTIFVWIGRSSKAIEKLHAVKTAKSFCAEFEIHSIVFVDDGYEKTLYDDDRHEFEKYLPLRQRSVRGTDVDEDIEIFAASKKNRCSVKLYYCNEIAGKYRITEIKSGPLKAEDLSEHDVYIIDHAISGVWIWVKKTASQKDKIDAMRNARGFVKKKKYCRTTPVTRIVEEYEPLEFRHLFKSWSYQDSRKSIGSHKIAVVKVIRFDALTMEERPALAAKSQLLDDGTGQLRIFRIKRFDSIEVPKERHGIFFNGDCYVVLYRYKTLDVKWIIYYWMGSTSIPDEQEYASLKALELDLTVAHGNAVFVRVIQGREPVHLLQLFKGRLRIFSGKGTDCDVSGKNMKCPGMYLLKVEGTASYDTKATQVVLNASSLNSNHCFVLKKNNTSYIWCGTHSTGDNREMAKMFVGDDFNLLLEGSESTDFWNALGGRQNYARAPNMDNAFLIRRPSRLYLCGYQNGEITVEELFNFSQKDLSPELILILDAGQAIYEWIGNDAKKEDQKFSIQLTKDFLKIDPSERDPKMCIIQVKQGHEPPTFTGFFETWDDTLWSNYKNYECLRTEIESDGARFMHKLTNSQDNMFDNFNKYPIGILKSSVDTLPPSVNPLNKELHLTYDDFMTLFEMNYPEFEKLPMWKRQEMKKNAGLF